MFEIYEVKDWRTGMKVTIVNCFDTNRDRVDLIYDYFKEKSYEVTVIESDFHHGKKEKKKKEKRRQSCTYWRLLFFWKQDMPKSAKKHGLSIQRNR